ncbi:cytochrome P450 [Aspergillus neoniger CBS 115656]|uniref:Cytochrome P450 n=1 Tax=Aspergillus neoniger (strain CBS 115656) TaxID=1448310 RepID=A0A318YM30_ASPNB|nr:cytochrome P450 [Aspergillus neoniger CBS 115656]PYH29288.1 cytochrome P450 [Aspergillus neoniger CBS 115656]
MDNSFSLDILLAASGISQKTRARLWSTMTAKTKEPIPRVITSNARSALRAQPRANPFTLKILAQLNETLTPLAASGALRKSIAEPAEVSLYKWVVDVITVAVTDGMMGKVCLDRFPETVDAVFLLIMNVYTVFQRRPRMFARQTYDTTDKLTQLLDKYFSLPREKRMDCVEFVAKVEDDIRSADLSQEELSKIILDNPAILAFWFLSHILWRPGLFSVIRAECEQAFTENSPLAPSDISERLGCCPTLKATFQETARLNCGLHLFRQVYEDTEVGRYRLRKGSRLMIAYSRVHVDKSHWGPDADEFNYRRFLDNPGLASSKHFKPFGDGTHQCGAKLMVPQLLMYFVAIVVCRYDFRIAGGFESYPFPKIDESKGRATVPMPVVDDVPRVSITPRKSAV